MQWFPRSIELSRQKWLLAFRLITISFLAVTIILIHYNGRAPAIFGYWLSAIVLAMFLGCALAFSHYYIWPRFLSPASQILIQMGSDILFSGTLIILTGGCESAIVFVFIIVVINSAFLGGLKSSFIAATLSTLAWALIIDLHYYGYLPGLPAVAETMASLEVALNILVNAGAAYLVAILGGHLSSQLDVSRQALKNSQNSLNRLSELNDNIIQSIDAGLITTDSDDMIISVNRAALNILKVSENSIVGHCWHSFFPELSNLSESLISQSQAFDQSNGLRFNHLVPDGSELVIELEITALIDAKSEIWGRLLVIHDRTAISQMETEVKRSEHLASMGKLAAGLAHEIRTPLASMTGSWHMLSEHSLSPEDDTRLMNIIGREMERLGHLVTEFLAFARPPAGNPQPVALNKLIEDQLHVLRSWQGTEINISSKLEDVPNVLFDNGQLTQVVWNILQNSMEAAEPGCQHNILVVTRQVASNPGKVVLVISDNGPGIPRENIRHIFEPFYTTKPQGTGLGLSTVWGIIQNGGGRISVSSTPYADTSFTIILPVA